MTESAIGGFAYGTGRISIDRERDLAVTDRLMIRLRVYEVEYDRKQLCRFG